MCCRSIGLQFCWLVLFVLVWNAWFDSEKEYPQVCSTLGKISSAIFGKWNSINFKACFYSQSNVDLCVFCLMCRKCSAMTVFSSIQRTQQRLFVTMIHTWSWAVCRIRWFSICSVSHRHRCHWAKTGTVCQLDFKLSPHHIKIDCACALQLKSKPPSADGRILQFLSIQNRKNKFTSQQPKKKKQISIHSTKVILRDKQKPSQI